MTTIDDIQAWEQLPQNPSSKKDLNRWAEWAKTCAAMNRWPRQANITAWRAVMATAKKEHINKTTEVAHEFLVEARQAQAFTLVAARRLVWALMEDGSTTPDTLYLVAAFAWPLRDLETKLSDTAWQYLINAPWQTNATVLVKLCKAVDGASAFEPNRSLVNLSEAMFSANKHFAAKDLLEAIIMAQANCEVMHDVTCKKLGGKPTLTDTTSAICRLARYYAETGATQVYAREILTRALQIDDSQYCLQKVIESTVWNRPFIECYEWCEDKDKRNIENEIKRAVDANQLHHARGLAESVLVRQYAKPFDYIIKNPISKVPTALENFCTTAEKDVLEHAPSRCAAEHLAVLYARTNVSTRDIRNFVRYFLKNDESWTAKNTHLFEAKNELQDFVTLSDPYYFLEKQEKELEESEGFSDSEKRLASAVNKWITRTYESANNSKFEEIVSLVTSPIIKLTQLADSFIPGIESVCATSFNFIRQNSARLVGDGFDRILRDGKALRDQGKLDIEWMSRAYSKRSGDTMAASAVAALSGLLPPGWNVLGAGLDLGFTLTASYRCVAKILAHFGIDARTENGFKLVADSFALGCSSGEGEGLAVLLSGRNNMRTIDTFKVGSVSYGATNIVSHLWTTSKLKPAATTEAVLHLSRLCGLQLSKRKIVKIVPLIGAVVSGISTQNFMHSICDAAVHLGAREALLLRGANTPN